NRPDSIANCWRWQWRWAWHRQRPGFSDSGAFLQYIKPVGGEVGQLVHFPARPFDFDLRDLVVAAQPESQRRLALRAVTRPAVHNLPLLRSVGQRDCDLRADAVAVRFVANGLEPDEPRLIAIVVAQQIGRAAIGRQQNIQISVVVVIAVSRASPDNGSLERAARASRRLDKPGFAFVAEELRLHRVGDLRLNLVDVIGDVTVGHKEIRLAVEIIIEKEDAESQRKHCRLTDVRSGSLVNEQSLALIAEDGQHIVRKVADDNARIARSINIREIGPHPSARLPFFAERYARGQGYFSELPVAAVVFVELVRLRVVGDEDVGPSVTVVVNNRHAE